MNKAFDKSIVKSLSKHHKDKPAKLKHENKEKSHITKKIEKHVLKKSTKKSAINGLNNSKAKFSEHKFLDKEEGFYHIL